MNHWLVKQEPEDYAFAQFVKDKRTDWTGVRNFQARNNLRTMKAGDAVLYYHSGGERAIVGTAKVSRAAFPDPTTEADEERANGSPSNCRPARRSKIRCRSRRSKPTRFCRTWCWRKIRDSPSCRSAPKSTRGSWT